MQLRYTFFSLLLGLALCPGARSTEVSLADATIADLQAAFKAGSLTSEKLTQLYLTRIEAFDKTGPAINTVITLNPNALAEAKALDAERRAGKVRSPLHGVPIVLKDNYDTFDLPTTAGSQLLEGSIPPDDAFVVKKLRAAGVVILAKLNLSEFASGGGSVAGATDPAVIKAGTVPNGFSSMGQQTLNPHDLTRGPAGSSGGTGAAIAAVFAQFGLGTDTAGSVRGPSAANGIVGLKTTLGLLSRDGVVPLALSFDTVGPMARNVYDVAAALSAMTGVDSADASTQRSAGKFETDYTQFLKKGSLKGARIGIARDFFGKDPETLQIAEAAIATLKERGAIIVEDVRFPDYVLKAKQPLFVLVRNSEFKAQIADYLATLKPGYPKTLDELIAKANDPKTHYRSPEKAYALKYTADMALDLSDPLYIAARDSAVKLVRAGTEAVFAKYKVDALLYPTATQPASLIRPTGPSAPPAESATTIVNESGFPELVVPAGMTKNQLPVTISFLGRDFTEGQLLAYGYDFEQATHARRIPKFTPLSAGETISK